MWIYNLTPCGVKYENVCIWTHIPWGYRKEKKYIYKCTTKNIKNRRGKGHENVKFGILTFSQRSSTATRLPLRQAKCKALYPKLSCNRGSNPE